MNFTPREHQRMMIDHMVSRPQSLVIAGMGLGKTASTLEAVSRLILDGEIKAALIVSPLRVTNLTWPNEIEKWGCFKGLRVANLRTEKGLRMWRLRKADIYLINYEMLPSFCPKYMNKVQDLSADMVVWDEISRAKNPSSKRIKAFMPHWAKFKYHVGLTGTPTPNSHLDLFGQVRLLDRGARLGQFITKFRNKHFDEDYSGFRYTVKPGSKEKIEEAIEDITITLSSEDWLDIPDTHIEDIEIALPDKARKAYKELEKELLVELQRGEVEALNGAALTAKLLQITGGAVFDSERNVHTLHDAKIKALKAIRKKVRSPLLVIYQYTHERDRILKAFPQAEAFREDRLAAWDKKQIPMWVANAQSIGHGLNLQHGSNTMVWMTPTYSRELYDQTNARLARTGQTEITTIYRILCSDTIDEAVVETLREKGDNQTGFLRAMKNIQSMRTL